MNQESNIDSSYNQNQKRVIQHLQRADFLLVFLPMVLAGIILVVLPTIWTIYVKESGAPDISNLIAGPEIYIIGGIFLCFFFCVGYGLLALILSLLTRHNRTFRIILVGILLSISTIFSVWFFILPAVLDFFS